MTGARRMAVLDDNEDIADIVCAAAANVNVECQAAASADGLLATLTQETQLILMDLNMPAMSGDRVMELLAQRGCRTRIVLMSGIGGSRLAQAREFGLSLGLNMGDSLVKPFRVGELMERLRGEFG